MTSLINVSPPKFPPGPVDGVMLSKVFAQFMRDVLARMDLRYEHNDFGGTGTTGQVLTSQGFASVPNWQNNLLASLPNDTVVGNVSGAPGQASALTQAQITTLINQFTNVLPGDVPASAGGTTNFLRADGTWTAPAYPVGANPTASVGTSAVNGAAVTFMRSDAAPQVDQTMAPTWTGTHTFNPAAGNAQVIKGSVAGTPVVEIDTQAKTGAQTITITLTNFPGTNSGAKTPTYVPITLDGSKYWIQALPD